MTGLTYDQLKSMFPWASGEFLRNNAIDAQRVPAPVVKQAPGDALDKAARGKGQSGSRVEIRFDFYAVRPKDADNHFVKPAIDALRRASLIPDDDWKHVSGVLLYTHRCQKGEERTEVRVRQLL